MPKTTAVKIDELRSMFRSTRKMLQLREAGQTFEEIGRRFHLTREAIRQRLLKEGFQGLRCSFCGKPTRRARQTVCRACRTHAARAQREAARIAHFWERVDQSGGPDACWPWTGCVAPSGYGRLSFGRLREYAHRVAWSLDTDEKIPRGQGAGCEYSLHSCEARPDHTRACCNPKHLYKGSPKENVHDREQNGHGRVGRTGWRKKTCKRGHDRTDPKNIYEWTDRSGKVFRFCRPCYQERDRAEYRAKKKVTPAGVFPD